MLHFQNQVFVSLSPINLCLSVMELLAGASPLETDPLEAGGSWGAGLSPSQSPKRLLSSSDTREKGPFRVSQS